jgi:hypothetical protein
MLGFNQGGNMDLIADLKLLAESSIGQGLPCSAGEVIKKLQPKEREALESVFDNRTIPVPHLLKALAKNGYQVSERALYKHRRKECRCFK